MEWPSPEQVWVFDVPCALLLEIYGWAKCEKERKKKHIGSFWLWTIKVVESNTVHQENFPDNISFSHTASSSEPMVCLLGFSLIRLSLIHKIIKCTILSIHNAYERLYLSLEVTFLKVEVLHCFCVSLLMFVIILAQSACTYGSLYFTKALEKFGKVLRGKSTSIVKRLEIKNLWKKLGRVRVLYQVETCEIAILIDKNGAVLVILYGSIWTVWWREVWGMIASGTKFLITCLHRRHTWGNRLQ